MQQLSSINNVDDCVMVILLSHTFMRRPSCFLFLHAFFTSRHTTTQHQKGVRSLMHVNWKVKATTLLGLGLYILSAVPLTAAQGGCLVCAYGPSSVPWLDKELPRDLGIPLSTCADIETTARLVTPGSDLCATVQSFGTYCGCNKAPGACTLCWDGSDVANPLVRLPGYQTSDLVAGLDSNSSLTCDLVQALFHSVPSHSTECHEAQLNATEPCGCPPIPEDVLQDRARNATNSTAIDDEPEPPSMTRQCTLCENGEPPAFPDKLIAGSPGLTCSQYAAVGATFQEDSEDCELIRASSLLCGCPLREDQCSLCPLGERVSRPRHLLNWFTESFLSTGENSILADGSDNFLTCELMESAVATDSTVVSRVFGTDETLLCMATQMKSWICGCRQDYRPILLTWSYRTSALLSFIVSPLTFEKETERKLISCLHPS